VYLLSSAMFASATGCRLKRLYSFLLPDLTFVSASESNPSGVVLLDLFRTSSNTPELSQSVFG
jgi:hypothetical protein